MDWTSVADHLVGVIDLKQGVAVHGVAGQRQRYQPVQLSRFTGRTSPPAADGDPIGLVEHYRQQGVRRFYVADLDGLGGQAIQTRRLEQLIASSRHAGDVVAQRWILDIGLNERLSESDLGWLLELGQSSGYSIGWVVASESALSQHTVERLAERVDPATLILGIDLREGRLIGPANDGPAQRFKKSASNDGQDGQSALDQWIESGRVAGIEAALILDVSVVGTSSGPAAIQWCHQLHRRLPSWRLISGGGCRCAVDVATYVDAGCHECLVATALHR